MGQMSVNKFNFHIKHKNIYDLTGEIIYPTLLNRSFEKDTRLRYSGPNNMQVMSI